MRNILSLLLLLSVLSGQAQGIPDMLFNKQYKFDNFVLKMNADKPYLRNRVEFTCNIFRGEKSTAMIRLDSAIVRACRLPIEKETEYAVLLREANLRLDVLNELNNSSRSYRGSKANNPRLTSVEGDVVSVSAGRVLYEVRYRFELNNSESMKGNRKLSIRRYYLGTIATGGFSAWKPSVNDRNINAIGDLVRGRINEQYLIETKKLSKQVLDDYKNYDEESGEEARPTSPADDVLKRISLSRADYYWYKGGLMIQFQEYTDGSKIFGGKYFRVFFKYDLALKIAALIPEFTYIKVLPRVKHNFKVWDAASMHKEFRVLRTEPSSLDIAKKTGARKVKSLAVTNNYLTKGGSPTFQGKTEYEFDATGKLLSTILFNENNEVQATIINDYDATGTISRSITRRKNKEIATSIHYQYDAFGNILERTTTQDDATETTYFFYNGDHVYQFSAPIFSEGQGYTLCSNNTGYELNEGEQVVALSAAQYASSRIQIGRDSNGRLVEVHADDDRDHYYFDYDNKGRIMRFSYYEYITQKKEVTYEYQTENPFPYRIARNSGDSLTEELLKWEFF